MSQLSDSKNTNVFEEESKLYSFSPALPLNSKVALAKNPDNESVIPQINDSGAIQQPKLTKVIEVSPNFSTSILNLGLDKPGGDPLKLKSQALTHNLSTISEASLSQEQVASEVESALRNETQENSSPDSEQSGEFIMVSPKQEKRRIELSLSQTAPQTSIGILRQHRSLNSFDGEPTSIASNSPHLLEKQIEDGPRAEELVKGVTKQLCKQSPTLPQSFSGSPTLATIQNPSFKINSNLAGDNEDETSKASTEPFKVSEVLPNFPSSDTLKTETNGNATTIEARLNSRPEPLPESFSGDTTHVTIQQPIERRASTNSLHSYDGESTKIALHDPETPFPSNMEMYFNHHQHTHLDGDEHHLPNHPVPVPDVTNSELNHKSSINSLDSYDGENTRVKYQNSPYPTPEPLDTKLDFHPEETKVEEHKLINHPPSPPVSFSGTPTYVRVQNPEMNLKSNEDINQEQVTDDSDLSKKREFGDLPIISHSLDIEEPTTISDMTNPKPFSDAQPSTRDIPKLGEFKAPSVIPIPTQESKEEFYDVEETPSNTHLQATSTISNSSSPSKKALKVQFETEDGLSEEEQDDEDNDEDVNFYKFLTLPSFPKKVPNNELVTEKYKKQIILAQFDKYEYRTQPKKLPIDEDEEDEIEQGIEIRLNAITESYLVLIDSQEQLRYFSHRQHTPHEEFEYDYDSLVPRNYDLIFCKLFHDELIKVLFPPRFFFIPISIVLGYIIGFYYYGFVGLIIGGYLFSYLGDYLDTRPNCSTITKWNTLNDNQRKACIHGLSRKFL